MENKSRYCFLLKSTKNKQIHCANITKKVINKTLNPKLCIYFKYFDDSQKNNSNLYQISAKNNSHIKKREKTCEFKKNTNALATLYIMNIKQKNVKNTILLNFYKQKRTGNIPVLFIGLIIYYIFF